MRSAAMYHDPATKDFVLKLDDDVFGRNLGPLDYGTALHVAGEYVGRGVLPPTVVLTYPVDQMTLCFVTFDVCPPLYYARPEGGVAEA
jgi:hypothetical protein